MSSPRSSDRGCAAASRRLQPMLPSPPATTERSAGMVRFLRQAFIGLLTAATSITASTMVQADTLSRGIAAFHRGQYGRALRDLWPLADRHNARALGLIGFMYENGFGVPEAYDAAADF